jgi:hypothetical protein
VHQGACDVTECHRICAAFGPCLVKAMLTTPAPLTSEKSWHEQSGTATPPRHCPQAPFAIPSPSHSAQLACLVQPNLSTGPREGGRCRGVILGGLGAWQH